MADTTQNTISCNRVPFLSEDGCDRGYVDIHQFDDLPYCEEIDPTPAEIPPEVLDTPVNIPIPPPCSCINIDYKLDFGYGTAAPSATFKAVGDCCSGNYESDLSLNLPCPVPAGVRKIKTSIGYGSGGNSKETTFYTGNKDGCSFGITDIIHDLSIGCPMTVSGEKSITVGIGYGDGDSKKKTAYISGDTGDKCSITPLEPEINLNLPCPVVGSGNSTLTMSVGYGTAGKVEKTYVSTDSGNCSITPYSPEFDLKIGCPVKVSGSKYISVGIGYGDGDSKKQVDYITGSTGSDCSITPLNPEIDLSIPCPVKETGAKEMQLEVKFAENPSPKKKFTIAETDNKNCNIKINEPEVTLTIPCPIPSGDHTLTMGVSYGDGTSSKTVPYITGSGGSSCSMTPLNPKIYLNIPCPLNSLSFTPSIRVGASPSFTITKNSGGWGGCAAGFRFDITVPRGDGGGGGTCVAKYITFDLSAGNGLRAFVHSVNSVTGESCGEATEVPIASTKTVTVLTDARYENNTLIKHTREITVLDMDEGEGEDSNVFTTTPLSEELCCE